MAGKEHAIEIVSFTFKPVRAGKYANDRRNRCRLINLRLHADAQILLGRQEMIDNVEAALAAWPVDRGDVNEAPELAALVVAQKWDDLQDYDTSRAELQYAVRSAMHSVRALM